MNWLLEIEMQSMLLPGSGGGGAIVDTEIVHDKYGVPYLPARRIKGLLRESAIEVYEMCQSAGLRWVTDKKIARIFGDADSNIIVRDCQIKEYEKMKPWLAWCCTEHNDVVNSQSILEWFTHIRYQTAMENGVTKDSALRNCRVIGRNLIFVGSIESISEHKDVESVLALACANLRRIGTMRNRGLGEVICRLSRPDGSDVVKPVLKACRKEKRHV